jgi:hypothetical protein
MARIISGHDRNSALQTDETGAISRAEIEIPTKDARPAASGYLRKWSGRRGSNP